MGGLHSTEELTCASRCGPRRSSLCLSRAMGWMVESGWIPMSLWSLLHMQQVLDMDGSLSVKYNKLASKPVEEVFLNLVAAPERSERGLLEQLHQFLQTFPSGPGGGVAESEQHLKSLL